MRVVVVGTGYVGLVAGAGFAEFGNDVVCVDVNRERIERLARGEVPIYEPHLDTLVGRNSRAGRLSFSTDTVRAVAGADVVFIAVGTPRGEDGGADLTQVFEAARDIGRGLTGWAVIVTKSTVPVGTTERVREIVAAETKHDFAVASNPEFLKEGDAVNDFFKPARVVIGASDPRASGILRTLYATFMRTRSRVHEMDIRSAELTKYAANAMLATRVSFMNELSLLCERLGADIEQVRRGIGSDPRIGSSFLFAGPGYGGSCFPKDLRALLSIAASVDVELAVAAATERANERQKRVLAAKVKSHFGEALRSKRIALWGLSFKPETDDVRDAPALAVIDELLASGASIVAHDPEAIESARRVLGDRIAYTADMYEAAAGADALVLVTEWHSFRRPDFRRLLEIMRTPVVFDGRNIWIGDELVGLGFTYRGIGRGFDRA